jgi:hypothetical protein
MTTDDSRARIALAAIALAFSAAACTPAVPKPEQTADAIYTGGDIVTVNDAQPSVEALAVKDGKILAMGTRAEVDKAHKGQATRVVDLGGKTLVPAFIDAHSHYFSSLTVANQVNVYAPPAGPGRDVESIVAALTQFAAEKKVPKGEVIRAYGYDENVMPNGRLLNRDDLDAAFADNPVIVGHVSMHGAVMNSPALAKFGISAKTKTPPGGIIVRKPGTNEPYGLVMETAYAGVFAALPKPTLEQAAEATRAGQMLYAREGVTLAHEGATHAAELEIMQRAAAAGANVIDVVAFPFILDLDAILAKNPVSDWGRYGRRLKIGGVKITIDGSPQGRTAFFTTPYLTGGPAGQKDWRGELSAPQAMIDAAVKKVYDLGVPLNLHSNGDGAIDAFLQAYEKARAGDFSRPWNVTTIHTQFLRKDQIPKFVEWKIRPSFYTLHTFYFAAAHTKNRGAEQAAYISPMRDAIDAGLRPSNHTDFYVAPLDQMFMMWSAVNRVPREGGVLGPDQRITPIEALKAQTIWAAEQYGEQDRRGSLEPGKIADLVVLSGNPLKVDPATIKDIQVLETLKDGQSIYRRP